MSKRETKSLANFLCQLLAEIFSQFQKKDNQSHNIYQNKKQVLILVINALKEDFVNSLKTQKTIVYEDCDQLYSATRYLWLGTESEFLNSPLKAHDNFLIGEGQEESEYDVYLITIELDNPHHGFKPNVNQLERISAFRTLAGSTVETSRRLRVEVFRDIGVYNR